MGKAMAWHPFAEEFPLLEGAEWESFKQGIKATDGIDDNPVLYRNHDGGIQGLDGRNRYRACRELRLQPKMKLVRVKDEDVEAYILRCNVSRRHMSADMRAKVVKHLASNGATTREIANTLGVSQSTVVQDTKPPAERKRSPKAAKPEENGAVVFDWKQFDTHVGGLERMVTAVAKHYKCLDTPQTEGLQRLLGEVLAHFKTWHKELISGKA